MDPASWSLNTIAPFHTFTTLKTLELAGLHSFSPLISLNVMLLMPWLAYTNVADCRAKDAPRKKSHLSADVLVFSMISGRGLKCQKADRERKNHQWQGAKKPKSKQKERQNRQDEPYATDLWICVSTGKAGCPVLASRTEAVLCPTPAVCVCVCVCPCGNCNATECTVTGNGLATAFSQSVL
jgi:hypothetical protein